MSSPHLCCNRYNRGTAARSDLKGASLNTPLYAKAMDPFALFGKGEKSRDKLAISEG